MEQNKDYYNNNNHLWKIYWLATIYENQLSNS